MLLGGVLRQFLETWRSSDSGEGFCFLLGEAVLGGSGGSIDGIFCLFFSLPEVELVKNKSPGLANTRTGNGKALFFVIFCLRRKSGRKSV